MVEQIRKVEDSEENVWSEGMISETQGSVKMGEFDKPVRKCERGAAHDAVKTVHPAMGVSLINGPWSQGDKRASGADKVPSAKHADVNHPSCVSVLIDTECTDFSKY